MKDVMEIGSVPCDEQCAQIGAKEYDYRQRAFQECRLYIQALRKVYGKEPEGAELYIKSNRHDYGTYYEVACKFDTDNKQATEYALKLEQGLATWTEAGMTAPFKYPIVHNPLFAPIAGAEVLVFTVQPKKGEKVTLGVKRGVIDEVKTEPQEFRNLRGYVYISPVFGWLIIDWEHLGRHEYCYGVKGFGLQRNA